CMGTATQLITSARPYKNFSSLFPTLKAKPESEICPAATAEAGQISRISNAKRAPRSLAITHPASPTKIGGEEAHTTSGLCFRTATYPLTMLLIVNER